MNSKAKKVALTGMLCALAFALVVAIRIPVVLFLKYEAKDIVIAMGGFIFGPLTAFIISIIVSFMEMITISTEGYVGFFMNVISTCSFVCTASYIYKKKHSIYGAIVGLVVGVILATGSMLLFNYIVMPWYKNIPREAVAQMLLPTFLPFNLAKHSINAGIILLIYKPIVIGLRKAHLLVK
jgi:riboflavin transporter FmnP